MSMQILEYVKPRFSGPPTSSLLRPLAESGRPAIRFAGAGHHSDGRTMRQNALMCSRTCPHNAHLNWDVLRIAVEADLAAIRRGIRGSRIRIKVR